AAGLGPFPVNVVLVGFGCDSGGHDFSPVEQTLRNAFRDYRGRRPVEVSLPIGLTGWKPVLLGVAGILEYYNVEPAEFHFVLTVLPFLLFRRDIGDGGAGSGGKPVDLTAMQLLRFRSCDLDAHLGVRKNHKQAREQRASRVVEPAEGKRSGLDEHFIGLKRGSLHYWLTRGFDGAIERGVNHLDAAVPGRALGFEQLDGEILEWRAGVRADDVGKTSLGVVELAVIGGRVGFRLSGHSIHVIS